MDYPRLYGRISAALGKIPTEVDGMTLWDVRDLERYWRHFPPVGELVAAALGYDQAKSEAERPGRLKESDLAVVAEGINNMARLQGVKP